MKRRLLGIALLATLTLPVVAVIAGIHAERAQWRKSVKRALIAITSKDDLVLLKFTEQEKSDLLNWKHEKEFEFRGGMYDIVSAELHCDTTYYYCWPDHQETSLNKKLDEWLAMSMGSIPDDDSRTGVVLQFFKTLICHDTEHRQLNNITDKLTVRVMPGESRQYEIHLYVSAPPPDCCLSLS